MAHYTDPKIKQNKQHLSTFLRVEDEGYDNSSGHHMHDSEKMQKI